MLREETKNIKSCKSELRKFGITVGIFLGLLSGLLWWQGKESYYYFIILSIAFVLLGIFLPFLLKPIQKIWMALAIVIGWCVTNLILGILFYLVLTSIGAISRLSGKHFLDLRMTNPTKSYWKYRKLKEFRKTDYERQF
jgi:hypothetical protein